MNKPINLKNDNRLKSGVVSDFKQSPSFDFTKQVMDKVELSQQQTFEVKPLISKKSWFFISIKYIVFLISAIIFSSLFDFKSTIDWSNSFSFLTENHFQMTFQKIMGMTIILSLITIVDLVYRKWKHIE